MEFSLTPLGPFNIPDILFLVSALILDRTFSAASARPSTVSNSCCNSRYFAILELANSSWKMRNFHFEKMSIIRYYLQHPLSAFYTFSISVPNSQHYQIIL